MIKHERYDEYSIEEYLKLRKLDPEDCRKDSFWNEMPNHHMPLLCLEGTVYGFMIRKDDVRRK